MRHTTLSLLACATGLALPLLGCGSNDDEKSPSKSVGFVTGAPSSADGFFASLTSGAEAGAKDQGVELKVRPPSTWDPVEQTSIVQALVGEGVGAIIIEPTSSADTDMVEPLRAANQAGVKIVTVDTFIGNNTYGQGGQADFPVSYIGSNNTEGGKIACDSLAEAIGGAGKVVVAGELGMAQSATSIHDREQGCRSNLADNYPDIVVLNPAREAIEGATSADGWGQKLAEKYLQSDPDLKGVFAINFTVAIGVQQAILDAGAQDTVRVIVFDCSQASAQLIHDHKIYGCIAQRPALMGQTGVEFAVDAMKGRTDLPTNVNTGFVPLIQDNINDPAKSQFVYGSEL